MISIMIMPSEMLLILGVISLIAGFGTRGRIWLAMVLYFAFLAVALLEWLA